MLKFRQMKSTEKSVKYVRYVWQQHTNPTLNSSHGTKNRAWVFIVNHTRWNKQKTFLQCESSTNRHWQCGGECKDTSGLYESYKIWLKTEINDAKLRQNESDDRMAQECLSKPSLRVFGDPVSNETLKWGSFLPVSWKSWHLGGFSQLAAVAVAVETRLPKRAEPHAGRLGVCLPSGPTGWRRAHIPSLGSQRPEDNGGGAGALVAL